ncbi:MAG: GldG family protein [Acidobacteriota bacterium]|nr:GldG family protein [Acidobacteriota bacterium]
MKARQTKFAAYTAVYVLIVVAVVGVLNFLANRYNKTYDTTSSKQFTLSDQTVKIAKNLKQDVSISYWDQPTQFQAAHDLLDRYKNLSPKIEVHYEDLEKNITQARAAGVTRRGAVLVQTGGKTQEAKSLSEEEVTGAFVRALKTGDKLACFTEGAGEHTLEDSDRTGYGQLKTLIEGNNYKTQSINLLQKPEIPKDCTMVIVGGPARDYLQPAVDALKSYVENGGKAIVMLDPPLKFAKQNIDENPALVGVLSTWGVTADKDLVLDTSGVGQLYGLGPEIALVSTYGTHPIVGAMKRLASGFPIARSLEIKNGAKTTVEKLFESTDDAFATTNLASAEIKPSPNDKKGPFILGAAGTFSTGGGRFVVVGSSSWVANSYLRLAGNRDLFLNMMNWLSADEDLISIRPKEPEDRRLTMTANQMRLAFYSSVLAIPLLILASGLSVWWKRR